MLNSSNDGFFNRGLPALLLAGALLVASALSVPVAGCTSGTAEVQKCDRETAGILDSLTSGLAAVRRPLALPLPETGAVEEALTDYRKTLSVNQDLLDKLHAPEPCRELVRLLRIVMDRGRDAADIATQFADYLGQVAPLAKEASELVDTISKLQPEARTSFGLVGLQDQAKTLLSRFQLVTSSAAFQEVHGEFGEFLVWMNENLEKALKVAPDDLPEAVEEGSTREGEPRPTTTEKRRSTPADEYLDEIPEEWESANRNISAALAEVMASSGFNSKNAEFDTAVINTQVHIQELEKKYGVALPKKK